MIHEKFSKMAPFSSERGRSRRIATAMMVFLSMIWGLTFPATKTALAEIEPLPFVALRFGISTFLFLILAPVFRRSVNISSRKSTHSYNLWNLDIAKRGSFIGIFLLIGFALQVVGLKYTTSSRSGFFTGLLVVLVPIFAALFRTSRSMIYTWLALLPAIGGVFLLSSPSQGGMNLGDWITLGCALSFALQMVAIEGLSRGSDESYPLTFYQVSVVALGSLIMVPILGQSFVFSLNVWLALAYTSVFGTVFALWMQTHFQPKVPSAWAAIIFSLEPVFAAFFGTVLLGDHWTFQTILGACCILSAMFISGKSTLSTE